MILILSIKRMGRKKIDLPFWEYYKSLEMTKKKELRDRICEQTGIAYPTFYSKLSRRSFNFTECSVIENLANKRFKWF